MLSLIDAIAEVTGGEVEAKVTKRGDRVKMVLGVKWWTFTVWPPSRGEPDDDLYTMTIMDHDDGRFIAKVQAPLEELPAVLKKLAVM